MNRQIFALWAVLAVGLAAAHNQPDSSQAGDSTPASAMDDQRAPAPALITGDSGSLAFSSELERSNFLRGGISVGASYDDKATDSPTARIGDFSYSVLPNIQLDQTRSRLEWTLGYSAGFTANQRLTQRNQGSHDLTGKLHYRLSPHVDLRLSDNFLDTTGFFQQFQNGLGTPVTGPINQPNPTLVTPLARSLSNTANADLSYQFSAADVMGVGGTFYDSHYREVPVGAAQLTDTSTRSGEAYLNHRFTARNWTGVTYKYQRMVLGATGNLDTTQSVLLTHSIYFREHTTLSFFAGPEYSQLDTPVVTMNIAPPIISFATVINSEHTLSAALGATFGWQGRLSSVRVQVTRQISDGGGVLGAVQLTSVGAGVRRQLTKSTSGNLGVTYGHNRELGQSSAGVPVLNSASGSVGLQQQLGQSFLLAMSYGRDFQKGGTFAPNGTINHNRGSISISYNFTRPLGR